MWPNYGREGLPGGASDKEPTCQCRRLRDACSIPGLGRPPGGQHATHFPILAWRIPWTEEPGGATVRRVAKSPTGLSDLAQHRSTAKGNGLPF